MRKIIEMLKVNDEMLYEVVATSALDLDIRLHEMEYIDEWGLDDVATADDFNENDKYFWISNEKIHSANECKNVYLKETTYEQIARSIFECPERFYNVEYDLALTSFDELNEEIRKVVKA